MSTPSINAINQAISSVPSPPSPPSPVVLTTPTQKYQLPLTTPVAPSYSLAVNHPMMKLAHFNGKEGEFYGWSKKFIIRDHRLRYDDILTGKITVDPNDIAEADRQLFGYSDLLTAASDVVAFSIVSRSVTTTFPMGCLKRAWANLNNRFNPKSGASMIKLKRQFVNFALSPDQDPSIWLMESEQLKQAMEPNMTTEMFLTHLISHLPSSYGMTINLLEMRHFEGALTLNMFRQMVSSTYDKVKSNKSNISGSVAFVAEKSSSSNTSSTTTQSSLSNSSKERTKCSHCSKVGHTADKCWKTFPDQIPTCNFCHKKGHNENKCFRKKAEEQEQSAEGMNLACITSGGEVHQNTNTWITDSGSSTHLSGHNLPLINKRPTTMIIHTSNGKKHQVKHIGDLVGTFIGGDGQRHPFTLKDAHYSPSISFNLFSLKLALSKGFMLGNQGITMFLTKGDKTLWFTDNLQSNVSCFTFLPKEELKSNLGLVTITNLSSSTPSTISTLTSPNQTPKSIDINRYHKAMGHINFQVLQHMAKEEGIKLTGVQEQCIPCLKAKFKTSNINKVMSSPSTYPGERLHIDLSSIRSPIIGGATYWGFIIDDYTKFKWSVEGMF